MEARNEMRVKNIFSQPVSDGIFGCCAFGRKQSERGDGEEVGAEGVEADVEAGLDEFGAGARIGNVVELVEKGVLLRCGDFVGNAHAALRGVSSKIHDNNFARVC